MRRVWGKIGRNKSASADDTAPQSTPRSFLPPATWRARLVVALSLGIVGALIIHSEYARGENMHTDFGMVWYGARALFERRDPYLLIGPGREFHYQWSLIYPATALVAVSPLAWLNESLAATIFVGVSTFVLALGITRKGWYLLPIFATEAYASAARLGQWSILLTAFLFVPWVGVVLAAKPQSAFPLLLSTTSKKGVTLALVGGLILLAASFVLQPSWPVSWIREVRQARFMDLPALQTGGPFVLLALIRWRRPEAWLIATLALTPQGMSWYSTLPLFTIPVSFPQSIAMAAIATGSTWIASNHVPAGVSIAEFQEWVGRLVLMTSYVPATILVLSRPNEGPSPVWLRLRGRGNTERVGKPTAG